MVQIPLNKSDNKIFKSGNLPVLFYAGQISDEPEWKFPSHKHDDLSEIIYISEGEGEFIIDNRFYRAGKNDILIYNKGIIHDEKSDHLNPLKTYFCGIGNLYINGVEEGCIIPTDARPVIKADKYSYKIESYISDIFEEISSQIMGYETICQSLVVSLIVLILRIINIQHDKVTFREIGPLGNQIKEYIDKNYIRNISIDKIADRLYISRDYLSHVFKNETGYSPINYMINRRIGEAKRLLLTTEMTIQQISMEVGYLNANYFSMLFKKVTGISPGHFRGENKKI